MLRQRGSAKARESAKRLTVFGEKRDGKYTYLSHCCSPAAVFAAVAHVSASMQSAALPLPERDSLGANPCESSLSRVFARLTPCRLTHTHARTLSCKRPFSLEDREREGRKKSVTSEREAVDCALPPSQSQSCDQRLPSLSLSLVEDQEGEEEG